MYSIAMIMIMMIMIMMIISSSEMSQRPSDAQASDSLNRDFSILSHPSVVLLTYSCPLTNQRFGGP